MKKRKLKDKIRKTDLSWLFGIWKTNKTAQELKDESREGWK